MGLRKAGGSAFNYYLPAASTHTDLQGWFERESSEEPPGFKYCGIWAAQSPTAAPAEVLSTTKHCWENPDPAKKPPKRGGDGHGPSTGNQRCLFRCVSAQVTGAPPGGAGGLNTSPLVLLGMGYTLMARLLRGSPSLVKQAAVIESLGLVKPSKIIWYNNPLPPVSPPKPRP